MIVFSTAIKMKITSESNRARAHHYQERKLSDNQFPGWRETSDPNQDLLSKEKHTWISRRHRNRTENEIQSNQPETIKGEYVVMKYTEVKSTDTVMQSMTASTTRLTFDTGASILKTIHPKPFSGEAIKTRIFILQINNKIADAAKTTEKRKIHYIIFLLWNSAAE